MQEIKILVIVAFFSIIVTLIRNITYKNTFIGHVMKKISYSPLYLAIASLLYASTAMADLKQQCLAGVPHFTGKRIEGSTKDLPVYVEADTGNMKNLSDVVFKGDVNVEQGNRFVRADKVRLTSEKVDGKTIRHVYLEGNLEYKDPQIQLRGNNATININSKESNIEGKDYEFVNRQGRGDAGQVELRGDYRLMKNSSFTSCLPSDDAWKISSSELRQNIKGEYAEMWDAVFYLKGIPIFYMPYWQIPLGDRRRSGFLMPQFSISSRDGYTWAQPVYWNIAPNFDATLTPIYMSHRGYMLNSEWRYLTKYGQGTIAGDYIGKDRSYNNDSRWLFYLQNNSSLSDNWRFNVNYTKVSDTTYFNDFDSPYGNSTDGYATQSFNLTYYQPTYNLSIAGKKFQIFEDSGISPYRELPKISGNYYRDGILNGLVDFATYAEITRFATDSTLLPTATRFHIAPELNMPLSNRYGGVNIQTKLYATHYEQTKGSADNAYDVEHTVNRVIPQLKVDLQTSLISNKTWFDGYTQVLEPQIQYLYRPYRNQSGIGAETNQTYYGLGYDSTLLQQDYYSLFGDRRYSGLDRISSANQVTLGGTTRLFDDTAVERFNFSIGQTYYFTPSRINDSETRDTGRSSSWALESNWKVTPAWNWHASYQYDTALNKTSLANTALQYNPSGDNLIQLSYRYASKDYIDQNLSSNIYNQSIKQLGVVAAWGVTDNWSLAGHYYYDTSIKQLAEAYAGVQYSTCCWKIKVGARRYLTTSSERTSPDQVFYNNSFGINFQLNGLDSSYSNGLRKMLEEGILSYHNSFSL